MIAVDEDAFICDMAETYHIFSYREVCPQLLATLACGLGNESRIKLKLSGLQISEKEMIQISILDHLRILVWQNTQDAQKGKNIPEMMLNKFIKKDKENDLKVFTSVEEFEEARRKIIEGNNGY